MTKLAFLFVAFALVTPFFYGCDTGPAEPDLIDESAVDTGHKAAFEWGWVDDDVWLFSETVYLRCLDETVVREGDWVWYQWYNWRTDTYREGRWFSPSTTMVGPSGTWTILRQLGPRPGQKPAEYDVDHVIWKNVGMQGKLHTFGRGSECKLAGGR